MAVVVIRSRAVCRAARFNVEYIYHSTHHEVTMKRLFALLLLTVFVSATLTACNTVNGAGKDIKKVGEKIEGASSK